MASKSFQLVVDTVNGELQEFPPLMDFFCEDVRPIGVQVIRDFNANFDTVAMRVFLFYYHNDVYGCKQFSSVIEFEQFVGTACMCCPQICYLLIEGCFSTIDGCNLLYN